MVAFAALILAALAFGYAWLANIKAAAALVELENALDAITLLSLPADAILTPEDGEEAELRFDRGH